MKRWVDLYPYKYTFSEWLHNYHQRDIPGTKEWYMYVSTHCFYCNTKFPKVHLSGDPQRKSIDHYHPKSKGGTERYVICCNLCNSKKSDQEPNKLVSEITRCVLRGRTMWGFHAKKLELIAKQIQVITHDLLFNTGPRVYYIKK